MDHDNTVNREKLDDDILQCRADILRSRQRSKPSASTEPIAQAPAVADKKTVRIPPFQELITQKKPVVDGQWETPLQVEPETELDPENIVTAEEEAALFPPGDISEQDYCQIQETASEEGLEALREVVELASSQARQEIEELDNIEGIEDMMAGEGVEVLADENADADVSAEAENLNDPQEDISNVEPISETEESHNVTSTIPKFNLAEKILTEQRQVASKRRQRPTAPRSLNVMPIAGTVGKIIEEAKKAVAESAKKMASVTETPVMPAYEEIVEKKPLTFDRIEVEKIEDIEQVEQIEKIEQIEMVEELHQEPALSVAACIIVNDSDRLNPFQEDIITDIVSRDIAQFCGELGNL